MLVNPRVEFFTAPEHASAQATFANRQDVGTARSELAPMARADELERESGQPGGGQGRIDVVGHSGVYPGSGPYPEGKAAVGTAAEFVHGQRDAQGREIEGGSELTYLAKGILLGGETPPPGGPPRAAKHIAKGPS